MVRGVGGVSSLGGGNREWATKARVTWLWGAGMRSSRPMVSSEQL